jgi:His/Glu/Gln/Arg/opine family amino acid ABC transporter permease subunit
MVFAVGNNPMDFGRYVFGPPYFGWLCRGVMMTLTIGLTSGLLAIVIGFGVVQCHISMHRTVRGLAVGFVAVFRNMPLLPLLLFLTFALPGIWQQVWGRSFSRDLELYLLLLGLALNTGAYISEILRAGISSVPSEQIETGRALGFSPTRIRRQIVYPQAIRIVAPALTSRLIHNMKNSTLALIVPLPVQMMEVVGQAGRIAGQTFSWAEPLIFASFVHLIFALGIGRSLNRWATREQARIEGRA